jgi:hypothetical protein
MLPASRRWASRSSFHAKRIQDRKPFGGVSYHSLFTPSEYKKFALICLLLLSGSLLFDHEGSRAPFLNSSSDGSFGVVKHRESIAREFVTSIKDSKERDTEAPVVSLCHQAEGETGEVTVDEEEAKKQEMRKFMEVYRTNCLDIGCRYLKYV